MFISYQQCKKSQSLMVIQDATMSLTKFVIQHYIYTNSVDLKKIILILQNRINIPDITFVKFNQNHCVE
jgi:hypothetical protein